MSVLVDNNTRVVVQGITGKEGSFHARQCIAYGTQVVAGVTPGKGGQKMDEVPVFNTVKDAVTKGYQKAQAETSFYEAGETLTSMSFEHPDSLQAFADTLGLTIKKSNLFTKDKGDDRSLAN